MELLYMPSRTHALARHSDAPRFQYGSVENQRMALQARVWEPATRRALQQAGLAAGQSALDVGCGACDVMRLMAEKVGEGGRVTGLDIDAPRAVQALTALQRQGPAVHAKVCRFLRGDVTMLATVAGAPFDLVFARRLLFHLTDPLPVLRRLWQWVRPGGALLVMDHDSRPTAPMEPHAVFERAMRLIARAFDAMGRDMQIGAHMPGLFERAGIGAADGCEVSGAIQPAGPSAALLRSALVDLRPTLTRLGLATEMEAHRLDGDLAAAATDAVHGRWPDLIATWKRKPA